MSGLLVSHAVTLGSADYWVRTLHPGDEKCLQDFFASHSPETIRLRYGYLFRVMSKERAHRLVDVDERDGIALGIFLAGANPVILFAVGRYCLESRRQAEMAFVVSETKRRCGMATVLLRALALAARAHGVEVLRAQVLRENYPMRRMLVRYDPVISEDLEGDALDYFLNVDTVTAFFGQDSNCSFEPPARAADTK